MSYSIGSKVQNVVILNDEKGNIIPVNTSLVIVDIKPKTCMVQRSAYYDDNPNYFIAIVDNPKDNRNQDRIRANFCTIRKIKEQN